MKAFVVDVNVPIVANGQAAQADCKCVLACVDALWKVYEKGMIVIDDGMRILSEYMDYLYMNGQPGAGDAFMKWVWENQAVIERCERVILNPKWGDEEGFIEFPDDQQLETFDRSDRKYVAVALASKNRPVILNAVDPDWWEHKEVLEKNGLHLGFLCPQHMA